jgi:hypothetical protein
VWNVVELSHDTVPVIGANETVCFVYLGAEVTENENGRLVRTKEERADEDFKVVHHFLITMCTRLEMFSL